MNPVINDKKKMAKQFTILDKILMKYQELKIHTLDALIQLLRNNTYIHNTKIVYTVFNYFSRV